MTLAVEMRGAGIGKISLDFLKVRREGAEMFRVHAGFPADGFEAAEDGGFRATMPASDFACAEAFAAIEPIYGKDFGIDLFHLGKGSASDFFLCFFGLRVEAGKQFAGNLARMKCALFGNDQVRIETEEAGAIVGEHCLAGRIEVCAGRREKNERLSQYRGKLGDRPSKNIGENLDRKDRWHGIGRPGANLEGVVRRQADKFVGEPECLAQASGEFGPIQFEGRNLSSSERNVGANRRIAPANSNGPSAVAARDNMMGTPAIIRAGQ